ncbi:MAG: aminopeptidase P N-terminal domain-containing protein, partial [Saprospiraceae bacterium]|nr:aminopeptidase P N-terminal domain-containing protein [Saprospiraceae bacterium]
MFPPNTYLSRRKNLKEIIGTGLILLLGNEESPKNYTDNTYHFRQDSTFLYYFGIQRPGLAAILKVDEDTEMLFG